MSDAVGPLYVGTGGGHHDAASSATKIKVDTEVTKLLNDSIGRVRALLVCLGGGGWGRGRGCYGCVCVDVRVRICVQMGVCETY